MDAEEAASSAREQFDLDPTEPVESIVELLERAAINVFLVDLGTDGIDGACWFDRDEWFIIANNHHHSNKTRFTLAHEFGHICLNHGSVVDKEIRFGPGIPDVEQEANAFAAAFLEPDAGLQKVVGGKVEDFHSLVEAACTFGVSAQSMAYRLMNTGRLDAALGNIFLTTIGSGGHRQVINAKGWDECGSQESALASPSHVPGEMKDAVAKLVSRDAADIAQASKWLRMSENETRSAIDAAEGE